MKLTKLIKISALSFLMALLIPGLSIAQEKGQDHKGKFMESLELTEEQKVAIKAIKADAREKRDALRDADEVTPEDRKALRNETETAIMEVLNPEQQKVFMEKKERRKGKRDRGEMTPEQKEKRKAAKEELKAYRKDNIAPVLAEKRLSFDAKLSSADKATIENLRATVAKERAARKAKKAECAQKETCSKGEAMEGKARRKKGHHGFGTRGGRIFENNETLKAEATRLVEKYDEELTAIADDLSDQKLQWKADQKAILTKYKPEHANPKKRKERGTINEERRAQHELYKKIGFLLIDPNGADHKEMQQGDAGTNQLMKAYPNPTTGSQTLEFVVAKKGMVKIDLVDMGGKVVETLYRGKLDEGPQTMEVQLPAIRGSSFYYLITDAAGTTTLPVVIAR